MTLTGIILEGIEIRTKVKETRTQNNVANFKEQGFWCLKAWTWIPSSGRMSLDMSLHPGNSVSSMVKLSYY